MSKLKISELSLKEVYSIFCQYWNEAHRIWIVTENDDNYNIRLALNDFLHFSHIDKIFGFKKFDLKKKNNYIRNKILKEELNFKTLEKSLKNKGMNKDFNLKK